MNWCLVMRGSVITGARGYAGEVPPGCVSWPSLEMFDEGTRLIEGQPVPPEVPKPSDFHFMQDSGRWALDEALYLRWLRVRRDERLTETDWVVTRSTEEGREVPEAWRVYRQALRDLTEQDDLENVEWPTMPEYY